MRLERLDSLKFKVFLTTDDLLDRGLTKEDLWHNAPKVQQLFQDVMKEANHELGFELDGKLAVEVYSLQAQGMVVIVTKEVNDNPNNDDYLDDYVEMQVTLDEYDEILYEFYDFEDVIALSHRLDSIGISAGKLYSFDQKFYLLFYADEINDTDSEVLIALLSEYANPAVRTIHRIEEYGKVLIKEKAVESVVNFFHKL